MEKKIVISIREDQYGEVQVHPLKKFCTPLVGEPKYDADTLSKINAKIECYKAQLDKLKPVEVEWIFNYQKKPVRSIVPRTVDVRAIVERQIARLEKIRDQGLECKINSPLDSRQTLLIRSA